MHLILHNYFSFYLIRGFGCGHLRSSVVNRSCAPSVLRLLSPSRGFRFFSVKKSVVLYGRSRETHSLCAIGRAIEWFSPHPFGYLAMMNGRCFRPCFV